MPRKKRSRHHKRRQHKENHQSRRIVKGTAKNAANTDQQDEKPDVLRTECLTKSVSNISLADLTTPFSTPSPQLTVIHCLVAENKENIEFFKAGDQHEGDSPKTPVNYNKRHNESDNIFDYSSGNLYLDRLFNTEQQPRFSFDFSNCPKKHANRITANNEIKSHDVPTLVRKHETVSSRSSSRSSRSFTNMHKAKRRISRKSPCSLSDYTKLHALSIGTKPKVHDVTGSNNDSKFSSLLGCGSVISTPLSTRNENELTDTPKINQASFLDFEYTSDVLNTPFSAYKTPIRDTIFNYSCKYELERSDLQKPNCIQDLNSLHCLKNTEKLNNHSKVYNKEVVDHLRNFNEVLLNTSQDINDENSALFYEAKNDLDVQLNLRQDSTEQVEHNSAKKQPIHMNMSATEISFFTPQLYSLQTASTPIFAKQISSGEDVGKILDNKRSVDVNISSTEHGSSSLDHIQPITLTERPLLNDTEKSYCSVDGVSILEPTCSKNIENNLKRSGSVKRGRFKSLSPKYNRSDNVLKGASYLSLLRQRTLMKNNKKSSPTRTFPLERQDHSRSTSYLEKCGRILAKFKKYHGRYTLKLPAKIIEICSWLGLTFTKGVTSFLKLYTLEKSFVMDSCRSCENYEAQISLLSTKIENLTAEINKIKTVLEQSQEDGRCLLIFKSEIDVMRRDFKQIDQINVKLRDIESKMGSKVALNACSAGPPPPPPPPPPMPPPMPLSNTPTTRPCKSAVKRAGKKDTEASRPIISLDDILKVKLKKTGDRPTSLRRATQPLVSTDMLRQIKLRPASMNHTPSSLNELSSNNSSLSTSPCSSLTKLLSNVDTNENSSCKT